MINALQTILVVALVTIAMCGLPPGTIETVVDTVQWWLR